MTWRTAFVERGSPQLLHFSLLKRRAFQRSRFLKLRSLSRVGKKKLPALRFTALTSRRSAKDRPTPSYKSMKLMFLLNSPIKSMWCMPYAVSAVGHSPPVLYCIWILGICLMSGGVRTTLSPTGSGILLAREEDTAREYLPAWSWQAKYTVNFLLWFFLQRIILWGLTLPCKTCNFYLTSNTAV